MFAFHVLSILNVVLCSPATPAAFSLFFCPAKGAKGILDKRSFDYHNEDGNQKHLASKWSTFNQPYFLNFYTQKEVVQCLDNISCDGKQQLHFSFVGDSRIRQHYLNFLKVFLFIIVDFVCLCTLLFKSILIL